MKTLLDGPINWLMDNTTGSINIYFSFSFNFKNIVDASYVHKSWSVNQFHFIPWFMQPQCHVLYWIDTLMNICYIILFHQNFLPRLLSYDLRSKLILKLVTSVSNIDIHTRIIINISLWLKLVIWEGKKVTFDTLMFDTLSERLVGRRGNEMAIWWERERVYAQSECNTPKDPPKWFPLFFLIIPFLPSLSAMMMFMSLTLFFPLPFNIWSGLL